MVHGNTADVDYTVTIGSLQYVVYVWNGSKALFMTLFICLPLSLSLLRLLILSDFSVLKEFYCVPVKKDPQLNMQHKRLVLQE